MGRWRDGMTGRWGDGKMDVSGDGCLDLEQSKNTTWYLGQSLLPSLATSTDEDLWIGRCQSCQIAYKGECVHR